MARRITTDCSCLGGGESKRGSASQWRASTTSTATRRLHSVPAISHQVFLYFWCTLRLWVPPVGVSCQNASWRAASPLRGRDDETGERFSSLFVTVYSSTSMSRQRFCEYSTLSAIPGSSLNATFQVAPPPSPPTSVALVCKRLCCCFGCFLRACVCVSVICRSCLPRRVYLRCLCKYMFVALRYLWLFSRLNHFGPTKESFKEEKF